MAVTGLANSGATFMPTDYNKKSFASFITRLMPNGSAPLFALTAALASGTALQFTHGYFTKTMVFPQIVVSGAGQLIGDVNWTIIANTNILPGMVFRNGASGENIVVNTVTTSTAIVVTRAVGTVAATAVAASQTFSMVGNAFEEGSTRPLPLYVVPASVSNYTQIFRNSWGITDTVRATQNIVGDGNVAENRNDAAMFHALDIEKALFFGQKFLGTRNSQPFHTMDGLVNVVTTQSAGNVTTLGATTNYTQLETALDPMFNVATDPKVANERVMFVGGTAHRVLNNIGRTNATYMMVQGQTEFGLRFETFKLTRGLIHVIEHPLFNSNATWAKMAIAVDLSSFRIMYLGDRRTSYSEYNGQGKDLGASDNGIDAVGGTYTSELTTEIRNAAANAILTNFTASAVG